MRQPNVIAAVSSGNNQNERIDPPIELPTAQVGLVDLPSDPDGFMRRALLFTNRAALSIQLLNAYLRAGCPRDLPLFWFWAEWQEFLWMLSWAIAEISLTWIIRQPLILILTELLFFVILLRFSYVLFLQQGWIPVVAPALALGLASITTLIDRQYQLQQQQQMMMRLLGQQTSPEIANALWEGRDRLLQSGRLPWQNVTATVLFTDIWNFSTIVEGESPEWVMGWLNEYLTVMADVVQSHQGVVNKFIGG